MAIETPEWVKHAVFYQIFPDRFARTARTMHPRAIEFKPWDSPPEEQGYQGDYIASHGKLSGVRMPAREGIVLIASASLK
jgi:glycosidase